MQFSFSDSIGGYVKSFDRDSGSFVLTTSDGREVTVKLTATLYAKMIRNLGEPWFDTTAAVPEMLAPGRFLFAYGAYYPDTPGVMEAQHIDFVGRDATRWRFEEPDWWIKQAKSIAEFFIDAQFDKVGDEVRVNYDTYRTNLSLSGERLGSFRQETDTISRLVYGFASTYLLTGEDLFLEAAEAGSTYLRDHMRFYDTDEDVAYWYHGIDVKGGRETKVFASEFGDDYDAVPMYEQIYALAGPTQTYRITGDPAIRRDIDLTLRLFDRFFKDHDKGGYYSHVDPITLSAHSESLGKNKAKKNWNSVGDHAPAYLINLWLATGAEEHKEFLKYTADCIAEHFPDYEHSPFVNERFFDDWSRDLTWDWQQNRAVVGHNLKIAWNLMRIHSIAPDARYVELAEKIAELMPKYGMDAQRGGWYDVVEREIPEGETQPRFVWHDRKAWWQQEQGVLAYEILYGILGKPEYLKYARESAAFYNNYFLDHEDGAVYFNVLANGLPYALGTERQKGSHSMSGYHSIELAYLAQTYTNLLATGKPLDLHFKPLPGGFPDGVLRVSPDILPTGSVKIASVTVDGEPWTAFDAGELTVTLPDVAHRPRIKVTLEPTAAQNGA
ncbi:AGE family epimerase/isomerase [Xylanimonas ulmi]|uniref:Mannose/cellobiose epimerase-like protein (N-acyl-D-glucosamine 2-epimerase family) n=1 Tax=Xylanimonas ulmi TaxID=228973 RepID=A0A4Q7M2A6_9MICO|nr:AGE family epimerase/isomerase [Xylanibacterium ulmi]RZS62006.1 mannose/cellobiose epimerase-like protein (N-acyl-D-glucosamine 2-epimerase family) [Xylanibacterium ulmi]